LVKSTLQKEIDREGSYFRSRGSLPHVVTEHIKLGL